MQHLPSSADPAVIFKWVKNSTQPTIPLCHNTLIHFFLFLILPLSSCQRQPLDALDLLTKQAENVSQTRQPAGQRCCRPPWARLELRTGNLRVALVSHAAKPLPDPTQTDTYTPLHPTPKHTHTHKHHPTPCAFSPQLSCVSSALIGLTEARSPHLLVEIG